MLKTAKVVDPCDGSEILTLVDHEQIDVSTALVRRSRDPAGVSTFHFYDVLGRPVLDRPAISRP